MSPNTWAWLLIAASTVTPIGLIAGSRFIPVAIAKIRELWSEAKWWEKVGLLLMIAPIPGPFDELAALLVARRIMKRIAARS